VARRLPEDSIKRRRQVFKRIYQNMEHWKALREDRGMASVITDELTGEDIDLGDLLVGLLYLPRRQREAFELICLKGYTETAARDELLPNSKSSTPVQQYADSGLISMIDAYDLKQIGKWPPAAKPKPVRKKTTRRRKEVATPTLAPIHPLLKKHLDEARADILAQIEGLKVALKQVDDMLLGVPAPIANGTTAVTQPAPNPVPEGKPSLAETAKELAGLNS
jgi:hypothetical protein